MAAHSLMVPVAIAIGGACGALARHYFGAAVMRAQAHLIGGHFPTGILLANILGSVAMGLLVGGLASRLELGLVGRSALQVGFLGAFTTFSTFSLDTMLLWERGTHLLAIVYVVASVSLAVAGLVGGMRLGHWLVAG
ncbi:fluoride efflux transporter CrcB [Marinibaculum pumilum]|uniref:Fluoride-specific ion channel FluC n=1 Tax=Marinibaculum pumilum TaxID=1766165 RepID=A0ABV7L067_9PROT